MEPNPTENLPAVKHDDRADLVMRPLMALDTDNPAATGYVTNVGRGGRDLAVFITNAMASPSRTLDDLAARPINVKYYIAHIAEFVSEGGEVIPLPRVLLIGPTGDTVAFTSEGAIKSLDMIRSLVGDGPWEPPLALSAVPVKTRLGRRTYRLVLGANDNDQHEAALRSDLRGQEPADKGGQPADDDGGAGRGKKR